MTRLALLLAILLAGCSAQPANTWDFRAGGSKRETIHLAAAMTPTSRRAPASFVYPAGEDSTPPHIVAAPPLTPEVLAGGTTYSGRLAWADPKYGPRYLALREPRGTRVLVCGPSDCVEMTSNDYGPVYSLWKQGRIADVAVAAWERICGVPRRFGLCPGSIQILRRPQIALPATSTGGEP